MEEGHFALWSSETPETIQLKIGMFDYVRRSIPWWPPQTAWGDG